MSGFPEWLPEVQVVEEQFIRIVRGRFELHGFVPLRTRSMERVQDLLSQGETDKEIYAVQRIGAPADEADANLALHYDLTVPFARYVRENLGRLTFPFRRYQIQTAWRGERPQLGRYREFLQADADIIVQGALDIRYDAELVELLRSTVAALPIPRVRLLLNNRKLLEGFYRGLEIADVTATLRVVDKLAKIGPRRVIELLEAQGHSRTQAEACVGIAQIEVEHAGELERRVRALGVGHPVLDLGLEELAYVLGRCSRDAQGGEVVAALHVARGLDYYTGTVVEGVFADHRELGTVCSGGRYDNLASQADSGPKLPGVGVSIGLTRILAYCQHLGVLPQGRKSTAAVFVAVHSEDTRELSDRVASLLRARGISAVVSDSAAAYGKQLRAADRLGIPYVWFPAMADRPHEVKHIATGAQGPAELDTWKPADQPTELKPA